MLLMSLTFAVGAVRLSRKGMLVQYMNAIESLANVDTVCLDKTGTLTDGNLVLYSVAPLGGAAEDDVRHARVRLRGQRRVPQLHPGRRRRRPAGRGRDHAGGGAVLVALEVERHPPRGRLAGAGRAGRAAGRTASGRGVGTRAGGPPGAGLRAGRPGRVPCRWRWRYPPDRPAGAGGAGGAAARRRRRHDRLPVPPGRRREGDVGRLAGDGGGRRRPRRRPRVRHAQAGVRPARGSGRAGGAWRARRRCSRGSLPTTSAP